MDLRDEHPTYCPNCAGVVKEVDSVDSFKALYLCETCDVAFIIITGEEANSWLELSYEESENAFHNN